MEKRKVQVVVYFCAPDKTKYFLLLKMNERRSFYWQNITGGVEENEDFNTAAIREAKEETAITKENIKYLHELAQSFSFKDQWGNQIFEKVFAMEVKQKWNVEIDPSEHIDFKWISEAQLSRNSVHFKSNYEALKLTQEIAC